jgi:pimeloyl-ACP methyl ester carboxylesterase
MTKDTNSKIESTTDELNQRPSRRDVFKNLGSGCLTAAAGFTVLSQATKSVAATDSIIAHTLFGTGSTRVIVLHDWSVATEGDYEAVKPFFDTTKLTMAFADVRGYGNSRSMKGSYTHAEISDDVAALADSLGWDKFSIIGHSMTGMSVQRIMANMPERLNRVVATVPVPASGFPLDADTFAFFESMATDDTAFKNGLHALTSGRYGDGWVNFKLAQNRSSVSADAMKSYTAMWSKEDFSDDAKGNETPILIVYGQYDNEGLRQTATGEAFKDWYPNLSEHVCPSGHYPMLETPVEYAYIVQRYLLGKNLL